ncbi:zf-HC2 domain containing protein [Streptomyces sp. WZ.A104]|uniref:anti-sigma factor family protein n=1 Tax=Streptomyces sp. WZ.A104 TaxID=2023771 RepID=UPI000BBC0ECC|nr:zf-HC2 domain-containing protein [Streptomyces sp. WZ.A104]PCG85678.1 zf-HC2 domain containing protein [Streptomyces sp. WZ.A104]
MSGTGPTPAEAHLGDRLAALVDGELNHDARERVLAHLATCAKCKAEADAQRRLKSAFAMSASPSPSEGFLARLQGLPGGPGGDGTGSGSPFGGRGPFADEFHPGLRPSTGGTRTDTARSPLDGFGYLPAAHGSTAVLPGASGSGSVFRIHEVSRDADRSPWRGRRFAFAAASAVSLAAIALGGTLPLESGAESPLRAEGSGNNVTPLDAETRAENGTDAVSRRGGGALAVTGDDAATGQPPSGTTASGTNGLPPSLTGTATPADPAVTPPVNRQAATAAPLLFGLSAPTGRPFTLPALNVSVPPLIRPTASGTPLLAAALGGGALSKPPPAAVPSGPSPSVPANDLASPLSPRR